MRTSASSVRRAFVEIAAGAVAHEARDHPAAVLLVAHDAGAERIVLGRDHTERRSVLDRARDVLHRGAERRRASPAVLFVAVEHAGDVVLRPRARPVDLGAVDAHDVGAAGEVLELRELVTDAEADLADVGVHRAGGDERERAEDRERVDGEPHLTHRRDREADGEAQEAEERDGSGAGRHDDAWFVAQKSLAILLDHALVAIVGRWIGADDERRGRRGGAVALVATVGCARGRRGVALEADHGDLVEAAVAVLLAGSLERRRGVLAVGEGRNLRDRVERNPRLGSTFEPPRADVPLDRPARIRRASAHRVGERRAAREPLDVELLDVERAEVDDADEARDEEADHDDRLDEDRAASRRTGDARSSARRVVRRRARVRSGSAWSRDGRARARGGRVRDG